MTGHQAAQIARDAATGGMTPLFRELSAQMCWDAVFNCQVRAGRVRPPAISTNSFGHVIATDDPTVASMGDMQHVSQGAFLGFFDSDVLIHAMLATGAGLAAGNKNACIGIGNPVGWEILNLAESLDWANIGGRKLTLRYRDM